MVRFGVLLLGICFVFANIALATETPSLPLGMPDFAGTGAPLQVSSPSPAHTTIALTNSGVVSEDRVVDFKTYKVFGIPGEPFIMEQGKPAIPQVSRFYRVPNTGNVELILSNLDDFELLTDVELMPLQLEGYESFDLARSSVYDQDQWYPPVVAEISEPQIMRDFRVVRVALYPVQVNPVSRQVRIYNNLQAEVVANDQPGINEITNPRPPSGRWSQIYRSMIENLDESALDDATEAPGSYLIISKNDANALEWADSLRTWKKRRGFDVVVDARSNWTATSMVSAIQAAYATWDPPLEFVALIGDPQWTSGVPSGSTNDWDTNGDFDHNFALGNSGDDLEDIGVGRLSGNSTSQMYTIHAKLMGYERDPFMADTAWYHRGFFYGSVGQSIASNYTLMQWGAQQFAEFTGVNNNDAQYTDYSASPSLVIQKFNLGISYFFWRGSWLGQMDNTLAGQTNPGWKLPVVLTITCGAGDFVEGLGTQESYLVAGTPTQPRGGVAAIGSATSGTHSVPNITVTGGLIYYIADAGVEHLGHALNGAKMWLARNWGPSHPYSSEFSRFNNLMGDPGLDMWTDVPKVMEAEHATTVNVGARHINADVTYESNGLPVEDALVVLWKGDETYVRGLTDANGHVELPVTVNTAGDLLLTITKHNHKPFLYTVNCVLAAQMVSLSSYTVDDDNSGGTYGNSDGEMNPGEVIDLPVYLRNFGSSNTGTNVSASLTSDNSRITVVSGSSSFANILPGDSALASAPFRIQVSPITQYRETTLLTLTVTASSVQTTSAFELVCESGQPTYISHQFSGTVNPGTTNNLQVTLRNTGTLTLSNATAQLTSLSPFVQVDDATGTFGNIIPAQQVSNSGDQFTLTSNSLTFRGHQASMRLVVSTSDGFSDTTQFTVTIGNATGTDPTGPDAYGYYAYDNTDVSYEMYPTFSYINISDGEGTDLNLNDSGEKTAPTPIWSTARPLPFPFTFYGVTYDTVTICANGWMAFGNQAWNDLFRNYAIPAMQAPDAMIAPYWDDLKTDGAQGVWQYYDAVEHKYIVQWKAQGYPSNTNLDFEVILLDEEFYPTFDGNGQILVQYNDVTMNLGGDTYEPNGCSIGIQKPQNLVGLSYAFITTYSPGAASVIDGRAIMFTTNARMLFGSVDGTVTDAETSLPLQGVDVTIDGYSYHTTTDASGLYLLNDVLIGTYTVRVHKRAFNDATVADIVVALDSTSTVNFSMLHPELALSRDTIYVAIPEEPVQTSFEIQNGGNGPLDYIMTITYAGDESTDPWDYLDGINISEATNDYLVLGCEFAADYWYVSGAGGGGQNQIYQFDTDGNYDGSIPQPSSGIGWFDMAWDGQYLYGSEQRSSGGGQITGIDLTGQVHATIPSPINPSRAIAHDPATDHFWVADFTSDIYEIDRQGNIVHQVSNSGPALEITGMAWHETEPNGFKLLLFTQNGAGSETELWKMHPVSNDRQLVTALEANPGERAGGLAITPGWNSTLLVLGGILQGATADRLGIYEVTFNTTWIDVTPMQQIVPGSQSQEVTVTFDPIYLRSDIYRVNLNIHSNVLDTTYVLPVVLTVLTGVSEPADHAIPVSYALYQNFPNPFNPSTTIRYDLKEAGQTKLTVFNLVGQEVALLVNEVQPAGSYQLNFDAASLPSGVYFYRIESGFFIKSAKMILMK